MRLRDSALTDDLLRKIPKAELHIHIEGSLEPEMMLEMAPRNGVPGAATSSHVLDRL
jgi:adenine deaminase